MRKKASKARLLRPKKVAGQALPMVLFLGVVLGVFALTMVFLLIQETKHGVMTTDRSKSFHSADAAVDRALAKLKEADNWNLVPNIPQYDGTAVFRDAPGIEFRLWIHEGDLVDPPGDNYADRTVTVDALYTEKGTRKRVQAVIARQPFTFAVTAGGGLAIHGNAAIYWGDMYNFDTVTDMEITNDQYTNRRGDGYPKAFSAPGTEIIVSGGGPTIDDCTSDPFYFANYGPLYGCPEMPDEPALLWDDLREAARASGCDWGSRNPQPSWWTGQEGLLIQASDSDYPMPAKNATQWDDLIQVRLDTMAAAQPAGCGENYLLVDDTTVFVDTQDGNDPASDGSNMPNEIKSNADEPFRGQFITTGDFEMAGGGKIPTKTIYPPPGPWLPVSAVASVNFEGLVGIGGDFRWAGSPLIYGSVLVNGNYDSPGNIEIYFNYYFPYDGVAGGTFAVKAWRELDAYEAFQTPTP